MTAKSASESLLNVIADSARTPTLANPRFDFLTDQVGGALLNDEAFISLLTEKVVSQDILDRIALAVSINATNPFDSIYIADLKPDVVSAETLAEIERVSGIKDVSDTIKFADDLD